MMNDKITTKEIIKTVLKSDFLEFSFYSTTISLIFKNSRNCLVLSEMAEWWYTLPVSYFLIVASYYFLFFFCCVGAKGRETYGRRGRTKRSETVTA